MKKSGLWNDIHVDYNINSGGEYGMGGRDNGGGYLPYQSQLSSFEEFLNVSSVGITSLDIGGDNTSLKLSAEKKKNGSGRGNEEYVGSLILVEEVSFYDTVCIIYPHLYCVLF